MDRSIVDLQAIFLVDATYHNLKTCNVMTGKFTIQVGMTQPHSLFLVAPTPNPGIVQCHDLGVVETPVLNQQQTLMDGLRRFGNSLQSVSRVSWLFIL